MYYRKKFGFVRKAFGKKFLPWSMLALGVVVVAAASGAGGAVGSVLSGLISGSAGLTVEQAVVIDRENLTNLDFKHSLNDVNVAVNDEGTAVTLAAEMHVGEELVFDLPLSNVSDAAVNMIARVETEIPVLDDIEVFWNTLFRATTPTVSNATPTPEAITSIAFQSSDTTPSTTAPAGVAGVSAQVSDGIATTSSPGLPAANAQDANSAFTAVQPAGVPISTTSAWYTGSFMADVDNDGALETINFVLTDVVTPGSYDTLDLSLGDLTFGSGSLANGNVDIGDDERIGVSTDIVYGTADLTFTTDFDSNPVADASDARLTSKTKYENSFDFDADASGALAGDTSEKLYWGISDLDSDGLYDTIDLSLGGTTFGQGTLGNTTVTSVAIGGSDDDERVTVQSTKVKIGTTFSVFVNWAESPGATTSDASILLTEDNTPLKFLGTHSWVIDADGDLVADDHVFFVISDTNSDGVVDTMDISIGDIVFGEGALGDQVVDYDATDNSNDERIFSDEIVTLGTHNFLIDFDTEMFDDEDDARITARWYTGTFPVDVDNNRSDNTLDLVLLDHNSDGLFTVAELDGDDSDDYTADEVHHGAASNTLMWFDPQIINAGASPSDIVGQYTSIDAASRDDLFISYYDDANGDLRFAKSSDNGQNWTDSAVATVGDVGQHTSIEALTASVIYISYYDVTNTDLVFAKSTDGGSSWATTAVHSTGDDVGQYSSITATSTTGEIYISYYDATGGALRVARSTDMGSTWTSTEVDTVNDTGLYTSIDTVHSLATTTIFVSYHDATDGRLKFATADSVDFPTFTTSIIESGGVGEYSSLVAVNDTTHEEGHSVYISYYDSANADLKVATSTDSGANFSTVTVQSTGDVGKFSSIAAVEPTTVFISYFEDAPLNELDKLRTTRSLDYGVTWSEPALVDAGNTVGQYNDLALFGTSNAFLSYWDDTDNEAHLKFARSTVLIDLEGHRITLDWNMNPTIVDNAILYDGRILNIAQLNRNEWLFIVPKTAVEGPSIEQTQIRIRLKGPDDMQPGFYTSTITLREYEG